MTWSFHAGRRSPRDEDRRTQSLAGLAIALLLVVVGLYLTDVLRAGQVSGDCLLAGRSGCDALIARVP